MLRPNIQTVFELRTAYKFVVLEKILNQLL